MHTFASYDLPTWAGTSYVPDAIVINEYRESHPRCDLRLEVERVSPHARHLSWSPHSATTRTRCPSWLSLAVCRHPLASGSALRQTNGASSWAEDDGGLY